MDDGTLDSSYHEAAHAVFHYEQFRVYRNLPVRYVSVGTEEHPERHDFCATTTPANPDPSMCLSQASNFIAAEYAVYKRRGEALPRLSLDEFVAIVRDYEELGKDGQYDPDEMAALAMLRKAADWPGNPWGDLESCYEMACDTAAINLEIWWPKIVAVAEEFSKMGYLDGEEVVRLIEAVHYGEEA